MNAITGAPQLNLNAAKLDLELFRIQEGVLVVPSIDGKINETPDIKMYANRPSNSFLVPVTNYSPKLAQTYEPAFHYPMRIQGFLEQNQDVVRYLRSKGFNSNTAANFFMVDPVTNQLYVLLQP